MKRLIAFFCISASVIIGLQYFANAAEIFSDDFETGTIDTTTKWSGKTEASGCTVSVVTSTKNSGSYGIAADDTANGGNAFIYKDISQNSVYVRFYVFFPTGYFAAFPVGGEKMIMRISGTSGGYVEIFTKNYSSMKSLRIQYNVTWDAQGININENTWYCVEVLTPAASGTAKIRWWVDNVEADPMNDDLSAIGTWNRISLGFINSSESPQQRVYLDELVAGDSYIGPIGADLTPPTWPNGSAVRDGSSTDISVTSDTTKLYANWDAASDTDSGILKYWYAVSTFTTNPASLTFSTVTVTNKTVTGTFDVGTTYYFNIKAENAWNGVSSVIHSDGQLVMVNDATPPSNISWVNDGILDSDVSSTYEKDKLSVKFSTSTDAQSGIKRYWYAIGTSAGATDVLGWTDNGKKTKANIPGLTLAAGQAYYFTVKAENGVGLKSAVTNSNGQTVQGDRADEYVWLHADGDYIKRSPYATAPNAVWQGTGICFRGDSGVTAATAFAAWAKAHSVNSVRISFNMVNGNIAQNIATTVNPLVQALKAQQIYSYLDAHEYMVDYTHAPTEGYVPEGAGWDVDNPSEDCQAWLDNWEYLAYYYKDEGWVMGYELCNEPKSFGGRTPNTTTAMCRNNFMKCLQNIRKIDTKHIILLGNSGYTSPSAMIPTWAEGLPDEQKFRPDPPYHNVVFAYHGYLGDDDVYKSWNNNVNMLEFANDYISTVQNTYHVPIFCTETGHEETATSGTAEDDRRVYQMENIEMCLGKDYADFWADFPGSGPNHVKYPTPRRGTPKTIGGIGWGIWSARGSTPSTFEIGEDNNFTNNDNEVNVCPVCNLSSVSNVYDSGAWYTDIWTWAAQRVGSIAPASSGVNGSNASSVNCTALSSLVLADGNNSTLVEAKIVDGSGNKIMDYNGTVTFSISGAGTWEDGTTVDKSTPVVLGYSTIKVKTTSTQFGNITVSAAVNGFTTGSVSIKAMQPATKVVLTANSRYIPANNDKSGMCLITATLKNDSNETLTQTTATFHFSVDKPEIANTYLTGDEALPVTSRQTIADGVTYINLKSISTIAGAVVLTASVNGLTSGTLKVYVGAAIPIELVKAYPNPVLFSEDAPSEMVFNNMPHGAVLNIYTISGKLVCTLNESNSEARFNGRNANGELIAQGIYLYMIKDPTGQKKTGKIAVKR
ncbi:MAG: hypothetical protein A3J83_07570 [Elusimicrobia bacterium RIFOXYA2_FULL_40_6]|nr:MAG: hypothetical protein A3J83_07570 [Elusimicrobia bacterium RIFOXYA2_FULL_40_6]